MPRRALIAGKPQLLIVIVIFEYGSLFTAGGHFVVPDEGIEPPTFGLQNRCSTAELIRLPVRRRGSEISAARAGSSRPAAKTQKAGGLRHRPLDLPHLIRASGAAQSQMRMSRSFVSRQEDQPHHEAHRRDDDRVPQPGVDVAGGRHDREHGRGRKPPNQPLPM